MPEQRHWSNRKLPEEGDDWQQVIFVGCKPALSNYPLRNTWEKTSSQRWSFCTGHIWCKATMGLDGMTVIGMAVVVGLFVGVLKQFGIWEPLSLEGKTSGARGYFWRSVKRWSKNTVEACCESMLWIVKATQKLNVVTQTGRMCWRRGIGKTIYIYSRPNVLQCYSIFNIHNGLWVF